MTADEAADRILQQAQRAETDPGALSWFLGPEAAAAGAAVRAEVLLPDGTFDAKGFHALAFGEWFRYLASDGTDRAALGAAVLAFTDLTGHGLVLPPVLQALCATVAGLPEGAGTEPAHAYEAGVGALTLFQQGQHPAALTAAERLLRHALAGFPAGSTEAGTCLSDLALAFLYAHAAGAGPQALADGTELARAALAAAPGDRDEQARRHGNLGFALKLGAEATGEAGALYESARELRQAVRLSTPQDPHRLLHLASLGAVLWRTAAESDDPALLTESVTLLRRAVAEADPALPPRAAHLADLGIALVMQAMQDGDRAELYDEGIATCRRAADSAPNAVERTGYLTQLALALRGRAVRADATRLLDDALAAARDAVEGAPPGHPVLAQARFVLAGVLCSRNVTGGSIADMDEAVALARRALADTPGEDLHRRVMRGTQYADLARMRAHMTDAPADLAEPIALLRDLARDVPERSEQRAEILLQLARCLLASGRRTGAVAAAGERVPVGAGADEAIACFRACLALPSPGRAFEARARFALGQALAESADPEDEAAWQEGEAQMRRGLALLPAGDVRRSEYLSDLGSIHLRRGGFTGRHDLYGEAVRLMREALAAAPRTSPSERAARHSNLGAALATSGRYAGDAGLLAEAVEEHRRAVALTPPEDHFRVHRLGNLGDALQSLAENRSDAALLREAVDVLHEAADTAGPGTPARASALGRLGKALRSLARFTGDPEPLREALDRHREEIAAHPGPPRPGALLGLANALMDHYRHVRDERVRDEALEHYRAALAATSASSGERFVVLTSWGYAEWDRAADTGDETLMDAAVDKLREAASTVPGGHLSRPNVLTNLGVALMQRAGASGERTWQAEAIAVLRRAVEESAPHAFDRAGLLSNLAEALRGWYEFTGDEAAADEAEALLSEAAARRGGDRRGRDLAVINLGVLLHSRALAGGADTTRATGEARRVLEEAVASLGEDHPMRPFALANLAAVCLVSGQLAADRRDPATRQLLHRASTAARECLARVPDGDPDRARAQWLLAAAQVRRAVLGERVDLAEAARLARESAHSAASPLLTRLQAARTWGEAAAKAGRNADALDGYTFAVGLLPRLAPRSLTRADQEERLRASTGLAGDAAALALRAGDPGRALALLEQGRGVLLAQGLDNRADTSRLRDAAPGLAAEFERLREQLSTPAERPPALIAPAGAPELFDAAQHAAGLAAEARHALARRWDELLVRIRQLPGFDDFLRPPALPQLLDAAAGGPVVVVNVSQYGSHAVLLTARSGIEVLPLPGLTPRTALTLTGAFISAVDDAYGKEGPQRAVAATHMLMLILRRLWDTVAAPVLHRLGLRTVPADGEPWPRLWWCPTGWLSFLPLHAAGHGAPGSGTWVLDRAVSSYTPTLRALARARGRAGGGARPRPAPLVVALPETPGAAPLPGASREAQLVGVLFPEARRLEGAAATVQAVGRALPDHPWVHFSCHGVSELLSPSESGLILHDGRLTVAAAAAQRPLSPELAVLSACSTSRGGIDLADEAVQLASAFQLAGYRHVIGTLWPVSDALATRLTGEFYAALAEDAAAGRAIDAALALHHPVRRLRDRYPRAPHLWAAHIHTGA
ncbi:MULTISPECIES: CHAT domain-containing protein [Streptomyces]|uniref:CHAT domain-containing protein n=1 Tax=Streptomyces luteosporeus TaxID=173856 RepID=A0ABN3TR85_9ACTN